MDGKTLRSYGFSNVKAFQAAYNGPGAPLAVDGVAGPKTNAAMTWMGQHHLISPHFSPAELRCTCKHCNGLAHVHRDLLVALEKLRAHVGRPLNILSGYRCPAHNAEVGGARNSQHLKGRAVDFTQGSGLTIATVRAAHAFTGLGSRSPGSSRSPVGHADVRAGSPSSPSVFYDASRG